MQESRFHDYESNALNLRRKYKLRGKIQYKCAERQEDEILIPVEWREIKQNRRKGSKVRNLP